MLPQAQRQKTGEYEPVVTITEGVCGGCGQTLRRSIGHKNNYELVRCSRCGNISTQGLECAAVNAADIYEDYYDDASFETPAVTAGSLNRLAASFKDFQDTGRWLDIGYGAGGLLSIAEAKGWKCYGTEIARRSLDHGQRRGWVVASEAEGDPRFPSGGFDVVTMIEFLEHVREPDRFLKAAASWLRPGGLLYLTTPNARSLNQRLLGLDWSVFAPPDHLIIWTPAGLRSAFKRNGFRVSRIRTEGLNPCEIRAHLAPTRGGRSDVPINRNRAALRLNEAISKSAFRRTIKRGFNSCLSVLRAGDTIKAWAIRDAGSGETK
ncbi:MAG TPA: class I SAM-dependent methyltransferase [Blastocatellia bacterium]|nr:class I SAM-dependent methyltransferase [Blastocatellia bacterium]